MHLVQPNCRSKLSEADIAFIISVFQAGQAESEALMKLLADGDTRDLLLDEKTLFHALLESPAYLRISLNLYFYVLVRNVLKAAGIDDRALADYIAAVLAHFARFTPRAGRNKAREPHFYVVDILEEIERANPHHRFYLITTLGNQALVLTSVFPDHIEYRARYRAAPGLGYYESVGSAQFHAASRHALAQEFQLESVYSALSDSFRIVRSALNDMRSRLLFLGERD